MSRLDTRKVQRTGKSTFVISLPKDWATKNGIQIGAIVYISQDDNGCLMSSVNGNSDLARDVMRRDDDVDKLNLLMQRQFMEILRFRTVKEEGLDAMTALAYVQAASNLERIADHAVRIAETCENSKGMLPTDMSPEIARLESCLEEIIDDVLSTLFQGDVDKANGIISMASKLREQIMLMTGSSGDRGSTEMLLKLTVTGSLERVLDYTVNIAKQSINLCLVHAYAELVQR